MAAPIVCTYNSSRESCEVLQYKNVYSCCVQVHLIKRSAWNCTRTPSHFSLAPLSAVAIKSFQTKKKETLQTFYALWSSFLYVEILNAEIFASRKLRGIIRVCCCQLPSHSWDLATYTVWPHILQVGKFIIITLLGVMLLSEWNEINHGNLHCF